MRHLGLHQHALVVAGIVQGDCIAYAGQHRGAVRAPQRGGFTCEGRGRTDGIRKINI